MVVMFRRLDIGDRLRGKKVLDVVNLPDCQIVKTENKKSKLDFRVKLINAQHPAGLTLKHAHFAIDFYGKFCQCQPKALKLLEAIGKLWNGENIEELIRQYKPTVEGLYGYSLELILYGLNWVLQQEDINFKRRSGKLQKELEEKIKAQQINFRDDRKGSQLAIGLLCDIAKGLHPVEAFHKARLRI